MNYTVSLRKRGNKWSYQIFTGNKYHSSKSGFKTKSEAKRAGDQAALKIKNPERKKNTFKEIADLYIDDGTKEETTKRAYKSWLKNFEPIYDIEMLKLTYVDVAPIIHDYYKDHKYNGTMSLLRFGKSIVNYAIHKLDYDMKNPFEKVTIEEKASKSVKKHQILTESEMLELFDKIENQDIRFLTMCFGLAGLRISEARGLTRNSFKSQFIHITQQKQLDKTVKPDTKSKDGHRKVPLDPRLKNELKKMPVSLDKNQVIVQKLYQSNDVIKVYRSLGYSITPHSLRHAYATMAIQKGVDLKTISYFIGDTLEVVIKTYAHVNTDMIEQGRKVLTNSLT